MKAEKTTSLPPSNLANKAIGVKGTADSIAHADAKWLAPPDASNIASTHIDGLEEDIREGALSVKIDPEIIKQGSDSSATMKILYAPEVQWAQIHWPEVFKILKMELDSVYGRIKSRKAAMEDSGNSHKGDYDQIRKEWLEELTMKAEAGPKAKAKYGETDESGDEPVENPGDVDNRAPGKSIQN